MPSALRDEQTLPKSFISSSVTKPTGWWANTPKYVVSLLKAYFGDSADGGERLLLRPYLPQIAGDYSALPMQMSMKDGFVDGYFVIGQNPASRPGLNSRDGVCRHGTA